ncbi:MAG: hypothetical protein Q7R93_00120 [bacterium]|nr:hypothetical protein [bacterium]
MFESLTHHAYAIAGQPEEIIPKLFKALEKNGVKTRGNPDFRVESFEVIGVDGAWALKEAAERKAVSGGLPAAHGRPAQAGKKIFIISARGITKEAQNALLKVFEEPPPDTHFFLVVPSVEILLPTLRSRLEFLIPASDSGNQNQMLVDVGAFLAGAAPARLAIVQKMLKALEGEKKEKEDSTEVLVEKGRILAFLDAVERKLAEDSVQNVKGLTELLEVKKYSRDRAPSFKLLLEHLALVLPKI